LKVSDFFKEIYRQYRQDIPILVASAVFLKFSSRWQDSLFGLGFFPLMLFLFLKIDIFKKFTAFIILLPYAESRIMPRQLFNIVGLNPINVMFVILIVSLALKNNGRVFKRSSYYPAIIVFLIAIFISVLRGNGNLDYSGVGYFLDAFLKPLQILSCGLVAFVIMEKPQDMRHFLRAIRLSSLILGMWILYRVILLGVGTMAEMESLQRFSGMHKNVVGFMFTTLLAMNLAIENVNGKKYEKVQSRLFSILYILVIMFTFSRQAYATAVLLLSIYAWKKGFKAIVVFVIGFCLFWTFFMPEQVKRRIYYGTGKGVAMGLAASTTGDIWAGRQEIWAISRPVIKQHFWLGQGAYTYYRISEFTSEHTSHPHNAYIQSFLDMGLIGSVFFIGFYVFLLFKSWFLHTRSKSKFISCYSFGFFLVIVAFLFSGYTGYRFYPYEESYFVWLFLGGLMWIDENQKRFGKQNA